MLFKFSLYISESDSIFVEHPWGELDKDAETTDEATKRLAICHLDWDRIYAKDLMVLLNSFLPADGIIESVTVCFVVLNACIILSAIV